MVLASGAQTLLYRPHQVVGLFGGDHAFADESVGVDLARPRMMGDLGVEQRLCEGGLVPLVVAPTAIADEVDEKVFVEVLPIGEGEAWSGRPRRWW